MAKFKPGDIVVWEEKREQLHKRFSKIVDIGENLYYHIVLNVDNKTIMDCYIASFEEENSLYTAPRFLTDEEKLELL